MDNELQNQSFLQKLKNTLIGGARNFYDPKIFHQLALTAFFAWVGLGADGLSSSSYGPEEAVRALGDHIFLSVFIAMATGLTVIIISTSYSQIIELFPTGGGGYLVASKLLSPTMGMISGSALLIDYVLTITISVASGADALFSFVPPTYHLFKLPFTVFCVILLTILNLRGVRESVAPLVPIFLIFLGTHAFVIIYAVVSHAGNFSAIVESTMADVHSTQDSLGTMGMIFLLMKAYSMGAGTYTGIEAVSNGIPILREPKVKTAKQTMLYMASSLAITVVGLMTAYLLYNVRPMEGKTLNAVLFEAMATSWGTTGTIFVYVTLISEAVLLFVAAQTGFLGGPRVLSNMALDRWLPSRFGILSDRLVTRNGVLLMGGAALILMVLSGGRVGFLVVLYSINVFLTFVMAQLGMVKHWWQVRASDKHWGKKLFINGIGLILTAFILVSVVFIKFDEGGWITILITGAVVAFSFMVKQHYTYTSKLLARLNDLVLITSVEGETVIAGASEIAKPKPDYNPKAKTAVVMVNGFNGIGLHTLFGILRNFEGFFKNFVFIQIGVLDAGTFKGVEEIDTLKLEAQTELEKYVSFMQREGYYAEGFSSLGTDIVEEIAKIVPEMRKRFSRTIFFGGQLVFPNESFWTRLLHNYIVFAVQRRFYKDGIPFVILPIQM